VKSHIPCWDNKQKCKPVGASRAQVPLKGIWEESEDMETGAKKWRKVFSGVLAMVGSLMELGETMKMILAGIQLLRMKMDEWRKINMGVIGP